jgi:hypothetical protein
MTPRIARAAVAALMLVPGVLAAQSWRTLDVSRQLHDSTPLLVRLEHTAGSLDLGAADTPLLYVAHLRYNAERVQPVYAFTPATRTLRVGTARRDDSRSLDEKSAGELRVGLTPRAPLDLELHLGAVKADLDLSRLRIDHLKVESGASEATVRFDVPNAERMRALDFDVGAASLTATRLANANADNIRVKAAVGSVDLDFGGSWSQDVELALDMQLGSASLRVPRDVGVRVDASRMLMGFEHDGLTKRGDAWYSDNWDSARYKLRVQSRMLVGRLELNRSE